MTTIQQTKIEWCRSEDEKQPGYVWNPIKGVCQWHICLLPNGKEYCYAKTIYKRFKLNPKPRLDLTELNRAFNFKGEGKKIFTCSTHSLFGGWVPDLWINNVFAAIRSQPKNTFIILTKNPSRAQKFAFPNNCWVGVSVENQKVTDRIAILKTGIKAKVKFISFEPLLGQIKYNLKGIDWVIIGGLSGERDKEKIKQRQEWAKTIMEHANDYGIPVFVKDNLKLKNSPRMFPKVIK